MYINTYVWNLYCPSLQMPSNNYLSNHSMIKVRCLRYKVREKSVNLTTVNSSE